MLLIETKIAPSPVHGIGLFAAEPITIGTHVWKFVQNFDQEWTPEFTAKLSSSAREQLLNYAYTSRTTNKLVLCADDARFINHSYTPNISHLELDKGKGAIQIAIRDISQGEELLCDYSAFAVEPPV